MKLFQDDIGGKEEKGVSSMPSHQCKKSVGGACKCCNKNFGILKSNVSHRIDEEGIWWKKDRINKQMINDDKKTWKILVTKRLPFFRFKLKKKTDLSEFGVAVVWDNSSRHHVSLVQVYRKIKNEHEGTSKQAKHPPARILLRQH